MTPARRAERAVVAQFANLQLVGQSCEFGAFRECRRAGLKHTDDLARTFERRAAQSATNEWITNASVLFFRS